MNVHFELIVGLCRQKVTARGEPLLGQNLKENNTLIDSRSAVINQSIIFIQVMALLYLGNTAHY